MRRNLFNVPASLVMLATITAGCAAASSPEPSSDVTPVVTAAPTTASEPSTAPDPSVAPASPPAAPALSETFSSDRNGLSISYPSGWSTRPATESYSGGGRSFQTPNGADLIYDPMLTDHLFLAVHSQPLGSITEEQWTTAPDATLEGCPSTEPITVDGAAGTIGADDCDLVLVATGGRGYAIRLYTSDDEDWLDSVYDRAWFMKVLATVDLRPADAT